MGLNVKFDINGESIGGLCITHLSDEEDDIGQDFSRYRWDHYTTGEPGTVIVRSGQVQHMWSSPGGAWFLTLLVLEKLAESSGWIPE